jgi:hypothetical protein
VATTAPDDVILIHVIEHAPMAKILDLARDSANSGQDVDQQITGSTILTLSPEVDMLLIAGGDGGGEDDAFAGVPPTSLKTPQIYFAPTWPLDVVFFHHTLLAFGGSERRMGV